MQILTTAVSKGGTAKTTTCAAIAQAATDIGYKVLVIDLDPQMNLTDFVAADASQPGTYQLLQGEPMEHLIQQTEQCIYAIPASENLAAVKTTPASAKRLAAVLEPLKESYDLCIIDTPPGILELQNIALLAATSLIIPVEADRSSLQGLYQIVDRANTAQRSNHALKIVGIVLTKYDNRPSINRHMKKVIRETGKEIGVPYLMEIRNSVKVREAQAMQQSLYQYAPRCKPAQDYRDLLKKIMEG